MGVIDLLGSVICALRVQVQAVLRLSTRQGMSITSIKKSAIQ